MSKKDYKLIAEAINDVRSYTPNDKDSAVYQAAHTALHHVSVRIAKALKKENENFRYTKFLEACGYPVE